MYQGKIIKFYREKAKITQKQLGLGICSTTHISKIERGLTEYSSEIASLLAKKLGVNIESEINELTNIKEKLDLWHEMIMSQNMQSASQINNELANSHLIPISGYQILYKLLHLKYNLKAGHLNNIHKQMKDLPADLKSLPDFEKNLYKHVLGIYNIVTGNHHKSIDILRQIDFDNYSNALVYYDLASAYHYIHSPVLAYHYADKALQLYRKKNNFLGIIDTEILMIIQVESDRHSDFKETIEQYKNLINICNLCNSSEKKAKILHNFAYEHLRRKNYLEALSLYKQSMDLKEKQTGIYILSLEGYIRCACEGQLLSQEKLLKLVHEGLEIAKELNNPLYTIVLTLNKYLVLKQQKQYYLYLSNKALPYFGKQGNNVASERYVKELFYHYSETGDTVKGMDIAKLIIESYDE